MTLEGAKNRNSILRELIANRNPATISMSEGDLSNKTGIKDVELIIYIDLIKKDGYIEQRQGINPRHWQATPAGIIFMNEENGYVGVYKADTRLERIATSQHWLSWLVMFWTGIAAIYYGLEVWRFFHPSCH